MMENIISSIFSTLIFLFLISSIVYSIRSRRQQEPTAKATLSAKLNINMGLMLVFLAIIQLLYSNESTIRIILGAVFLLLGLFNLFAGLRNLSFYRNRARASSND